MNKDNVVAYLFKVAHEIQHDMDTNEVYSFSLIINEEEADYTLLKMDETK